MRTRRLRISLSNNTSFSSYASEWMNLRSRNISRELDCSASGNQVDDQNNYSDHQQEVDQAACDVKAETEKPQNQKNDKDRPKHRFLLGQSWEFNGVVKEGCCVGPAACGRWT
jgi:hypothetical protein